MTRLTSFTRKRRVDIARRYLSSWLDPDPEVVAAEQLKRLRNVWADATQDVPYYRQLVESGQAPAEITSLDQFTTEVPLLTRDTLVNSRALFVRDSCAPDGVAMTAGSTGNPLQIGYFKQENENTAVNALVGRMANGLDVGDRVFLLWGHSHLLGSGFRRHIKSARRIVQDWLIGYYRVSAYHMQPESARGHMRAMLRFHPHVLLGYSSAIDLLVRHSGVYSDQAKKLGIKFVIATGEVLPYQDSKSIIEDFFECPVVMEYGGVDFGIVAYNTPNGAFRSFWWDYFVESNHEPESMIGSLSVTTLYRRYTPLIRYQNGDDMGEPELTVAGGVVRFGSLEGRHHDVVRLSDGAMVHSMGLFHCIHQESSVYSIQLVVEQDRLRLLLVSDTQDRLGVEARIRQKLVDLSSSLQHCDIEFVPDLVTNRAGKRRWIVDARPGATRSPE